MVAIRNVARVEGMKRRRPPIRVMSCSPCRPWITAPEPRKRHALKNACVTRCIVPAKKAPTPTPMNMKPSCDTVEYASTFLMSFCEVPIWAALIGTSQNDIKKVLAYSTVSQLGFMFIGVGVGAFFAGTMHLVTHAFFKACLFLGSGAVIHGLHGEQDKTRMGGLR